MKQFESIKDIYEELKSDKRLQNIDIAIKYDNQLIICKSTDKHIEAAEDVICYSKKKKIFRYEYWKLIKHTHPNTLNDIYNAILQFMTQ